MKKMKKITFNIMIPVVLILGTVILGKAQISTAAQLKAACESLGNTVNINMPTKIEFGPAANVTTGCTINIGPNASFGVKQVNMTFAGALVIQSVHKTEVSFEDALWTATSVNINLAGESSVLTSKQSRLQANAGNVSISFGDTGKLEVVNPFGLTNPNGLQATGSISLSGGNKFSGVFGDANLQAGTGISINLSGADSILKFDEAGMATSGGTVSVSSTGAKTNIEMSQATYSAPAGVSVTLTGADTGLKVKDGIFSGGSGSVSLQAGSATASFANIEVNQSSFTASGNVQIRSGLSGKTIVDNVQLNGSSSVDVRSGNQGSTLVKNSRGTSNSVTIATGLGGICLAENNLFTAPVQNLCL